MAEPNRTAWEAGVQRALELHRQGRLADAEQLYQALLQHPQHGTPLLLAELHSNHGVALQALRRSAEALASFDHAIALQPDDPTGHYNRGITLQGMGRPAEAIASYSQAIALEPQHVEAHYNRGLAWLELMQPADALAGFDAAIRLRPGFADAHNNRGVALQALRRPEEALACYDTAIALQPDHVDAHHNKGLCLLLLGRFEQGWPLYEWRKRRGEFGADRSYRQPLWLGDRDILGKTLLLHAEQGLGDTIQFSRYAKLVEACGAQVIMQVPPPLGTLLGRSFPTMRVVTSEQNTAGFDYHCPLLSLPLVFATTLDSIPCEPRYLLADDDLVMRWSARLGTRRKPRIGLVWRGGRQHWNDRSRSVDLATCLPLLQVDAGWVCLQQELRAEDADTLRQSGIAWFGDELADFDDTAALVALMDLVVTVDTSVAHLAAAMGKPVWLLLPFSPDWRWLLDRDDSPWYPTLRLFRQQRLGDWAEVVSRVMEALRTRC